MIVLDEEYEMLCMGGMHGGGCSSMDNRNSKTSSWLTAMYLLVYVKATVKSLVVELGDSRL